jgi:hypothetical protein
VPGSSACDADGADLRRARASASCPAVADLAAQLLVEHLHLLQARLQLDVEPVGAVERRDPIAAQESGLDEREPAKTEREADDAEPAQLANPNSPGQIGAGTQPDQDPAGDHQRSVGAPRTLELARQHRKGVGEADRATRDCQRQGVTGCLERPGDQQRRDCQRAARG